MEMHIPRILKCRLFFIPAQCLIPLRSKSVDSKMPVPNVYMHNQVQRRIDNIIKSPNDKRSYRGLMLKNQMKVMLISDPEADKSAASMDVKIGYSCDPDDLPGLAHFCEHMLFLGTKKYPQANDYNLYLSQNGGSSNATTYMDHTNYYFDVDPERLRNVLDRFSQFFISPLFTETYTELELQAIDSEHSKNIANDSWRIKQLKKSSANPSHPYSKFSTGNRETLQTIPKQKGINVRDKLLEFHGKYYSANIMSLCVLGKESLDELEKMVADLFGEVQDKGVKVPEWPYPPYSESQLQKTWYIVPIKDIRTLTITFGIPDFHEYYKSQPGNYVSHLIGHEGKGSLLSALKKKGWCSHLYVIQGEGAKGYSFFSVYVDLTEEGIEHTDDIVLLIFQYINMLNREGPTEWFFNEQRDLSAMSFQFKEKRLSRKYASQIAFLMQEYPMEDVLTIGYLMPDWKPELINSLMTHLTPQNARVHIVGKKFESVANETEKWYGVKFKAEKISQEVINKWSNSGHNPAFHLPSKNEFIPTKFDLKKREPNITKYPEIVEDTPFIRLWYKQDDEYLVPRANLTFDFVSPVAYMDPVNYNLNCIFIFLFRDAMDECTYAANLAGLEWDLSISKHGMTLIMGGFDDKQRVLLEKLIDSFVNFKVDPKRFEIFKNNYIRHLKNFSTEQPYKQAGYYLAILLSESAWNQHELLKATSQLTFERMEQYIPQFLNRIHIECLMHGNITMSEAIETAKSVESKLLKSVPHLIPLLPRHLTLDRNIRLEDGCNLVYEVENNAHRTSCTKVYYQAGLQSTEANMLLELLCQIIFEPCFTTLRTTEQLGYIVASGVQVLNGVQGLMIIVQGDRHPRYFDERINVFIESMLETVNKMSEEEFARHKDSLASRLLEKPKTLATASLLFWNEISLQQYNFDRVNIEVAYLKTISKDQLLRYFKEIIHSDARQKLSVHVISTAEGSKAMEEAGSTAAKVTVSPDNKDLKRAKKIEDVMTFKLSQSLYPILKPYNDIPRKGAQSSKL